MSRRRGKAGWSRSACLPKTFQVEIRASIEALLTGINSQYKDTRQARPRRNTIGCGRCRHRAWRRSNPFKGRMLDAIRLQTGWAAGAGADHQVDIPVPGYTKVPRISLIVLEGDIPVNTRELGWYCRARSATTRCVYARSTRQAAVALVGMAVDTRRQAV